MKYFLLLGDGMADTPVPVLGGRTPLEAADKPHMDRLAREGETGMALNVPKGMKPGSDTANMSCMGYDPAVYYTGRSPLEAVSMGIDLAADAVAMRCNLVTLTGPDGSLLPECPADACTMADYSSGEITTEEARELIAALQPAFAEKGVSLYPGISYRHCLVLGHTVPGNELTPPHDITGLPVAGYLPEGKDSALLRELIELSRRILAKHPVNLARAAAGKNPANSCWFWGEGTRPALKAFSDIYGMTGGVVCAVDLIRGLGLCAGMKTIDVPGATGAVETNFRGKGEAAVRLFDEGCDMVYIHVESPDECGHQGMPEKKVWAIEQIDREILAPVMEAMEARGEELRILLLPDHPTPIAVRTHTSDPVPYVLWQSGKTLSPNACRYTEAEAARSGIFYVHGHELTAHFLERA